MRTVAYAALALAAGAQVRALSGVVRVFNLFPPARAPCSRACVQVRRVSLAVGGPTGPAANFCRYRHAPGAHLTRAAGAQAFTPAALPSMARAKATACNMAPSKVKNENPDDFATYLAKRQVCASLRQTRCRPCARNPCPLSPTRDDLPRSPPVVVRDVWFVDCALLRRPLPRAASGPRAPRPLPPPLPPPPRRRTLLLRLPVVTSMT